MVSGHATQTDALKNVGKCIEHDPASWDGVSLAYLRMPDEKREAAVAGLVKNHPGALALNGNRNDCLLLGADKPQDTLVGDASSYVWIPNIASEWEQALRVIQAMVSQSHAAPAAMKNTPPTDAASLSILVVEDDPMTSRMVANHLQKFGKVTATKNAREATANNAIGNPDIIFLDIHYKDDIYDGFDVLTNILSVNAKAFVVMFSANRDPATILKSLSLGARGFIAKPFRAENFARYLAELAGN